MSLRTFCLRHRNPQVRAAMFRKTFWQRVVLLLRLCPWLSLWMSLLMTLWLFPRTRSRIMRSAPLTQLSLKRSLEEARESYCAATWAAPADSPMNEDLSNTPQLFGKMRRPGFPPRNVPCENICYKCSREIFVLQPLRGGKRISCNACNAPFHEKCFYSSVVKPEDGLGPCCLEAQ